MAHMVETMAYAGQLPWHGLGTRVSENISVDDMLKESGLDWEVQKVPAYAELNGQKKLVTWKCTRLDLFKMVSAFGVWQK